MVRGHHGRGSLRHRCVLDEHLCRRVVRDHHGHGMMDVNHGRHVGHGRHDHGVVRHQSCRHDVGRHCDRRHHRRAVGDALRGLAFLCVRVRLVRPR